MPHRRPLRPRPPSPASSSESGGEISSSEEEWRWDTGSEWDLRSEEEEVEEVRKKKVKKKGRRIWDGKSWVWDYSNEEERVGWKALGWELYEGTEDDYSGPEESSSVDKDRKKKEEQVVKKQEFDDRGWDWDWGDICEGENNEEAEEDEDDAMVSVSSFRQSRMPSSNPSTPRMRFASPSPPGSISSVSSRSRSPSKSPPRSPSPSPINGTVPKPCGQIPDPAPKPSGPYPPIVLQPQSRPQYPRSLNRFIFDLKDRKWDYSFAYLTNDNKTVKRIPVTITSTQRGAWGDYVYAEAYCLPFDLNGEEALVFPEFLEGDLNTGMEITDVFERIRCKGLLIIHDYPGPIPGFYTVLVVKHLTDSHWRRVEQDFRFVERLQYNKNNKNKDEMVVNECLMLDIQDPPPLMIPAEQEILRDRSPPKRWHGL